MENRMQNIVRLGKNERKILEYLSKGVGLRHNQYRIVRRATMEMPTRDETTQEISNANAFVVFSQTVRRLKDKGLIKTVWMAFDMKWLHHIRKNVDAKDGPSEWYPHGGRPMFESDAVSWTGFSITLNTERKPDFIHYLQLTDKGNKIMADSNF